MYNLSKSADLRFIFFVFEQCAEPDNRIVITSYSIHYTKLYDVAFLTKVAGMYKERVNFAHEILAEAEFLFVAPATYDEKTVQKRWKAETPAQLAELAALLVTITDADAHAMETVVKDWIEAKGYNLGGIMNAFRLALVGASKGPHIFDIVALIGIDETVARIHAAIKSLS